MREQIEVPFYQVRFWGLGFWEFGEWGSVNVATILRFRFDGRE